MAKMAQAKAASAAAGYPGNMTMPQSWPGELVKWNKTWFCHRFRVCNNILCMRGMVLPLSAKLPCKYLNLTADEMNRYENFIALQNNVSILA